MSGLNCIDCMGSSTHAVERSMFINHAASLDDHISFTNGTKSFITHPQQFLCDRDQDFDVLWNLDLVDQLV